MARVKGGYVTRQRRKRTIKLAKGYYGAKSISFKMAKQQVMKSYTYAYRDRRQKKRDFLLGQDYIRTARAKGVSYPGIIGGHALKNAIIPVITYFGPMLAYIVTGSLVVERIFAVPGIGRAFVNSITGRDYPLIMGTTIILASLIVLMNLLGDIMYKLVDPRISFE